MVDQVALSKGLDAIREKLSPNGMEHLSQSQQVAVTKYLVQKIAASDEILGAVTRKVQSMKGVGSAKASK